MEERVAEGQERSRSSKGHGAEGGLRPGRKDPAEAPSGSEESGGDLQARVVFAIFVGLLGWFVQGLGEFGLFVPALAWTAFTLLGGLIGRE